MMAPSPITSWQIEGGKMEAMTDFIFLVPKITMDSDCIHEIKRRLLLGRKAMTKLDSILKSKEAKRPRPAPSSEDVAAGGCGGGVQDVDQEFQSQ